MSRKREPLSAEMQKAQEKKLQNDKNFLNEITKKMDEKQTAQPENNNTQEVIFENETPLIFNFIQFVKGEAHRLRFVGMVCHELDTARMPELIHVESNLCEDKGQYKQYYLFELLNEQYKPTGVYYASNKYWHLEEFFVEKINTYGQELSRYPLQITLADEIEKKGQQPIKIFNIQRGKNPIFELPEINN